MNMKVHISSSISFAMMHIANIHVTHCLHCHVYAFAYSYFPYLDDCIHVGGAYECYMSLSKALMYVVINYQKGGD